MNLRVPSIETWQSWTIYQQIVWEHLAFARKVRPALYYYWWN